MADKPTPPPDPKPDTTPASTTAIVTGTVDAPELEAPLAGATVKVVGTTIETVTDAEGKYTARRFRRGRFTLRIEFAGFKTVEQEVVALLRSAGRGERVDVSRRGPQRGRRGRRFAHAAHERRDRPSRSMS